MRKSVALLWTTLLVWGLAIIDALPEKSSLELEEAKKNLQSVIDKKVNECINFYKHSDVFKDAVTILILKEETKHISNRKLSKVEIEELNDIVNKKQEDIIKNKCTKRYEVFQNKLNSLDD